MKKTATILLVFLCLVLLFCIRSGAEDQSEGKIIILDPGHSQSNPGVKGISGIFEVEYNDVLVEKIASALKVSGFIPVITRKGVKEMSLDERAAVANTQNALLLLSIHHDSVQPKYLRRTSVTGKQLWQTRSPVSGYSLFVSEKNPQFSNSMIFAGILARHLQNFGRKPSMHHAEAIPGENKKLLDKDLGIYRFDNLVILRKPPIPAMLFEVGVVVDASDAMYVTTPENQEAIVRAVVQAIEQFRDIILADGRDK